MIHRKIFWGGKIRPGIIDDIGSTLKLFGNCYYQIGESKLDEEKIIDGLCIKETC